MQSKNLSGRKVLIADDDDDSRTLLGFLLEQENWEVIEARDGKEAVEKVLQEKPDLLILDYRMPELTGTEVCQHLMLTGINLVTVLVTAHRHIEELTSSVGTSYFVSKPYDIVELLNTIESAYEKSLTQNNHQLCPRIG
ncbi:response regulator [Nostoc sp. UHCC 0870]|uniref:response regulator n=1 Tax=Nostoc sp. UHCC 0870 TaxID=2914041 RepID=UPI001EDD7176|nr:response regulator [Nostoc sp. UHCC 0870]UKO95987.1 response regulator [Nostoc sp. UHCC 0870]